MPFNVINAGDRGLASIVMENFRHAGRMNWSSHYGLDNVGNYKLQDLGDSGHPWKNLYLADGAQIFVGGTPFAGGGGGGDGFPMDFTIIADTLNKAVNLNIRAADIVRPMIARYNIQWGDGSDEDVDIDAGSVGLVTHTYDEMGIYNAHIGRPTYRLNLDMVVYGFVIDESNPNPQTSITYTDGAVGMDPANVSPAAKAAWDATPIFNQIRPCMFKNGAVNYYLNPNDFTKKADGSAADISSGNDGDVMIEVPKLGLSITKNANAVVVKLTNEPNNPNFKYYAHTRNAEGDRDYLYIGAYKASVTGTNLYSLSGKQPTVNTTINTFRTYARNRGVGYDQITFYARTLLQALFLLKYKNLDAQTALGQGISSGSARPTGGTNTYGMDWGSTSTTTNVKFAGVEDLWGNVWEFIEGIYINSGQVTTAFNGFNDNGSGYTNRGVSLPGMSQSWITKVAGSAGVGFVPTAVGGSASTYYTDGGWSGSTTPYAGGSYGNGSLAGLFAWGSDVGAGVSSAHFGARLMFL